MRLASRLDHIEPFYVMECAKAAQRIAASPACDPAQGGERMIFLNIGEPDFTAPPLVQEAAERAIREGRTQYTDALGLPALRDALSGWYAQRFGLDIPARRIMITAGASAALQPAIWFPPRAGPRSSNSRMNSTPSGAISATITWGARTPR